MDHRGTLSTDFVPIHGNEMDLDSCPAAPPGSSNTYDGTTYVPYTNSDSAMDGYDQENDILGPQTDFKDNSKRRYKTKKCKKRSSSNRVAIYTPRNRTENQSQKISPLTAGNQMILDEGTASVESHHLEGDPDYSTDMGSLYWEEFRRPPIAVGIAGYNSNARIQGDGNRILVTKGLVDSFSAFGIDNCISNVHTQADENGNLATEE
ncbi:hypothetical protein EYC80_000309 [Monilinia laxa]|uniref:Uncharacterized protein n=1 Tax=Monilinia laxa TaxID=61186 RepID=A0A5N6KA61_MONLA|nr:hypothetical protein EYC80_000309 [Monilinia laxa]